MKLIKPSYEILEQSPGLGGIYEAIERAGRTCYKSERKEGTTAKDFVDKMIASQHYAMLEHGTVYLMIPVDKYVYRVGESGWKPIVDYTKYTHNPYCSCFKNGLNLYVTTNYRVLVENGWLDDLKYLCEPTEYHEKRITVRFTTDRGVSHEFVRHRVFSFAQESTRYCNYSKDKFGNELTFIIPSWIEMGEDRITTDSFGYPTIVNEETYDFLSGLGASEKSYFRLINRGWKPQQARQILPNALKTEIVMTGFVSDWKHFFNLRTSIIAETGKPHPDMSALADPLYQEFVNKGYYKL